MSIQKITPNFWFDKQAEEAAEFYVSVFGENSAIDDKTYYNEAGQDIHGMEEGTVMNAEDSEKAKRAMNAMLQMKKLDIQKLQEAFEGK